MLNDGEKMTAELDYAPLPANVSEKVRAAISQCIVQLIGESGNSTEAGLGGPSLGLLGSSVEPCNIPQPSDILYLLRLGARAVMSAPLARNNRGVKTPQLILIGNVERTQLFC